MAQEREAVRSPDTDAQTAPTVTTKPPGVQALEALVAAKGIPEPEDVVAILDAHRGDRDAIFAYLHQTLGNGYVQKVVAAADKLRLSLERKELVAGDPSDPQDGYFIASQKEQGARWRTADGDFTGKVDKSGLDTTYRLDEDDALHARVSKDKTGSLAWERDGKTQAELYGGVQSGQQWEAGVRRPWELDGGTLTAGLRHQQTTAGARDEAVGTYKTTDGKTTGELSAGIGDGEPIGRLAGSHAFDGYSLSGSLTRDPHATTLAGSYKDATTTVDGSLTQPDEGRTTGLLSARHQLDPSTGLSGSYTRTADRDAFELGATHRFSPELDGSAKLRHEELLAGGSQTTLSLSERYKSAGLIHGLDLTVGGGDRDYLSTTGSVEGQLAPKLYAGAWGTYTQDFGKQADLSLGASLTFTATEKTALTLAGLVDEGGKLETRLQLDIFKKKIDSLSALSQHKKDALVSLFVSYSTDVGAHGLDDRFGAPQLGHEQGQWMGGIRIKF